MDDSPSSSSILFPFDDCDCVLVLSVPRRRRPRGSSMLLVVPLCTGRRNPKLSATSAAPYVMATCRCIAKETIKQEERRPRKIATPQLIHDFDGSCRRCRRLVDESNTTTVGLCLAVIVDAMRDKLKNRESISARPFDICEEEEEEEERVMFFRFACHMYVMPAQPPAWRGAWIEGRRRHSRGTVGQFCKIWHRRQRIAAVRPPFY